VISKGELIVVEDKAVLMRKLGKKQLSLSLRAPLQRIPEALAGLALELTGGGAALLYTFDTQQEETGIAELLKRLAALGIEFKDLHSSESSLEDIFVSLVHAGKPNQSNQPDQVKEAA
jgi:ABC-2 type transport system ATP-binding protein